MTNINKSGLYSIGYGNRTPVQLFDLVKSFNCSYLVDVRSVPYSRYHKEFNRDALEQSCSDFGLKYLYLGEQIGGKPDSDSMRDELGLANYEAMAQTPHFLEGIARLQKANEQGLSLALMCAELKPEVCHRTNLIGNALAKIGIDLTHIDEKAQLVSHAEVLDRASGGQVDMFT